MVLFVNGKLRSQKTMACGSELSFRISARRAATLWRRRRCDRFVQQANSQASRCVGDQVVGARYAVRVAEANSRSQVIQPARIARQRLLRTTRVCVAPASEKHIDAILRAAYRSYGTASHMNARRLRLATLFPRVTGEAAQQLQVKRGDNATHHSHTHSVADIFYYWQARHGSYLPLVATDACRVDTRSDLGGVRLESVRN